MLSAGTPKFVQRRAVPINPIEVSLRRWHLHNVIRRDVEGMGAADQGPRHGPATRPPLGIAGSCRDGLLCRCEDVACGGRTRYVLRSRDAEVQPSRVHGLVHFFGRSGVALRNTELF